jgi:ubiquinone/menaquinone biosynthesis C-methylase UbiE
MRPANTFKDYFSQHADSYAKYRPDYPRALFAHLASLVAKHERAWDCATGNGQAALGLTPLFAKIVATDASAQQISLATPHERISYVVARSEQPPIASGSLDLITIAQALHWLDFNAFNTQVTRVMRPGGVIAAWCYGRAEITPAVDGIVRAFQDTIVGPYWPPERRYVDEGYRNIPFPFDEIAPPEFHMEERWNVNDLIGYLGTWSSTRQFIKQHNENPVKQVVRDLQSAWGEPAAHRTVRWELSLRVGRVHPER